MPALIDLALPEITFHVQPEKLDAIRQRTQDTCERYGFFRAGGMSRARYLAARFELLAAYAYPHADLEGIALCNDFHMYLFYVDDRAEEDPRWGKDPHRLERYFLGHIAALREGRPVAEDDAAGRMMLDLRARFLERGSLAWLERMADDVSDYLLRGTLVGARHFCAATLPPVDAYLAQRAWDSAMFCSQDLFEITGGGELPPLVTSRRDFRALRLLCTNVVAFANDLVSYPKEVQLHQSPNNLVHLLMCHQGMSLDDALARVIDIVSADVARFEQIVATLPAFDPETSARLGRYVAGQRSWMSANLVWSIQSGRYVDTHHPFPELRALRHEARRPAVPARSARRDAAGHTDLPRDAE